MEIKCWKFHSLTDAISGSGRWVNQNKILYDPSPRVMGIKTKLNKWDLIKLKSFCTASESISKVKRQPSEWENIITMEQLTKD